MPIGDSFMNAYMEQQANVAKIQSNLGPSLKNILTNYGCDSACLDSVPLDVVTIAQATAYCSCPSVIDVQPYNMKSMDISKVLKEMNVPEVILKKRRGAAPQNLSLVSTTPGVVPQTSYMSNGLMAAAVFAGGYLYGKNRNTAAKDSNYSALL
jgi:hypothetical protein